MWAQEYSTKGIRDDLTCIYDNPDSLLTTAPLNIAYHEGTGNVIVGMGLQGVLVGTPDEEWQRVAVGDLVPTDFPLAGKARMAFSTYFWLTALGLCLCLVTAVLVLSPRDIIQEPPDRRPGPTNRALVLRGGILLATMVVGLVLVPALALGNTPVPLLILLGGFLVIAFLIWRLVLRDMETGTVLPLLLLVALLLALLNLNPEGWGFLPLGLLPIGLVMVVLLIGLALPPKIRASLSAILGVVLSSLGFPPFGSMYFLGGEISAILAISGLVFATIGLASYPPPRDSWRASAVAILAMLAAIVVPFSIWVEGSIPVVLAAVLSLGLMVFTAYRLSRYMTERMRSLGPPPPWRVP